MGRIHLNVVTVAVLITLLITASANAQPSGQRTMDRHAWRWHAPTQNIPNLTFQVPARYGYFPYAGYGYVPYGSYYGFGNIYGAAPIHGYSAYHSNSFPTGQSLLATEQAHEQYLKNMALFNEIRREQRKAIKARKAIEDNERWERRARNLAGGERLPSDLYKRLTIDQLDVTTGEVNWPQSLQRDEFIAGRKRIESAMSDIAENGPGEKTAKEIHAAANQMKKATNSLMAEIGFAAYTEARKFLGSLSAEGYYAMGE